MVEDMAPAPRRRLSEQGMLLRRRRIFARLREGLSYEEIAAEEGVTGTRIRQIVSDVLQKRAVDSGADHAKLQLDRLAPVMQLAAEAIAEGNVSAIAPYLRVLDRIDRYQSIAGAIQLSDDGARKKLIDKINRIASNLEIDEAMKAAAREVLRKHGMLEDEPEAAGANSAAEPPLAPEEKKTLESAGSP